MINIGGKRKMKTIKNNKDKQKGIKNKATEMLSILFN